MGQPPGQILLPFMVNPPPYIGSAFYILQADGFHKYKKFSFREHPWENTYFMTMTPFANQRKSPLPLW